LACKKVNIEHVQVYIDAFGVFLSQPDLKKILDDIVARCLPPKPTSKKSKPSKELALELYE